MYRRKYLALTAATKLDLVTRASVFAPFTFFFALAEFICASVRIGFFGAWSKATARGTKILYQTNVKFNNVLKIERRADSHNGGFGMRAYGLDLDLCRAELTPEESEF
jgi:hypothetical protein